VFTSEKALIFFISGRLKSGIWHATWIMDSVEMIDTGVSFSSVLNRHAVNLKHAFQPATVSDSQKLHQDITSVVFMELESVGFEIVSTPSLMESNVPYQLTEWAPMDSGLVDHVDYVVWRAVIRPLREVGDLVDYQVRGCEILQSIRLQVYFC